MWHHNDSHSLHKGLLSWPPSNTNLSSGKNAGARSRASALARLVHRTKSSGKLRLPLAAYGRHRSLPARRAVVKNTLRKKSESSLRSSKAALGRVGRAARDSAAGSWCTLQWNDSRETRGTWPTSRSSMISSRDPNPSVRDLVIHSICAIYPSVSVTCVSSRIPCLISSNISTYLSLLTTTHQHNISTLHDARSTLELCPSVPRTSSRLSNGGVRHWRNSGSRLKNLVQIASCLTADGRGS